MNQVLVIAKDPAVRDQLRDVSRQSGVSVEALEDLDKALAAAEKEPPVLVLAEDPASDEAMDKLARGLKQHAPVTPLLVYLPRRDGALALRRMAAGAYDCLCPPLTPGDFLAAAKRSVSRTGRRLFTSRRVRPSAWWKSPLAMAAAGLAAFLALLALGLSGLWAPPFKIYKLASDHPVSAAADKDALWVVDWSQQNVTGVKVQGGYLSIVRVHKLQDFQPVAMALAPYYAYTASSDGRLRRHRWDDELSTVAAVPAPGPAPSGLAWDGENLWSCDSYTGKIYQHNARLEAAGEFPAPTKKPVGLAWADGALWIADGERASLWKMTRHGADWKRKGPFPLEVFSHNKALQLSGFTVWDRSAWIVSESGGVLVKHKLPRAS
jgi:CheY-like chemotaxis protein